MEKIVAGSVVIVNHDMYWKYKKEIDRIEDRLSRGFGVKSEVLDTNFAKSVKQRGGSDISYGDKDYLSEIIEAVKIFEEKYPKIN